VRELRRHLDDKAVIIWDFNGTILDDVELCVDIISDVLAVHGLPRLDVAAHVERFRFPIIDYYRDLGFDFARTPFAVLAGQFMERYKRRVGEARLFDGTAALLSELASGGIASAMLSASHEPDLHKQLDQLGIRHHFTHVYGLGDHYAHSKVERGRQLLAALERVPEEVVLVGDTDHDLEVGEALGVDVVLVTGGHSTYERLSSRHHRVVRRA
jgi:phosphoglycolate phosphatase